MPTRNIKSYIAVVAAAAALGLGAVAPAAATLGFGAAAPVAASASDGSVRALTTAIWAGIPC
jgi:hypothetical protein